MVLGGNLFGALCAPQQRQFKAVTIECQGFIAVQHKALMYRTNPGSRSLPWGARRLKRQGI
jgi:hypothetical protein